METVVRYKCSVCNRVFDNAETATNCENSHVRAESVYNQKFYMGDEQPYPRYVLVDMSNGDVVKYMFSCVVQRA